PAIVWSWFGGMAIGEALARVLVGEDEPSGRLPFTIPKRVEDAPCDISQASPPGELHYTEGSCVGHRWYQANAIEPAWWFGEGGSYTTFEWGAPVLPATATAGAPFAVNVPVTNTGDRVGHDVVLMWVGRRGPTSDGRPPWQLAGFAKVGVEPGATVSAAVEID